jgi:hypothetical protein
MGGGKRFGRVALAAVVVLAVKGALLALGLCAAQGTCW